jgi:hypothetical protein
MYYVSLLQCWHPVMILIRTDHPYLRVGCHRDPYTLGLLLDRFPTGQPKSTSEPPAGKGGEVPYFYFDLGLKGPSGLGHFLVGWAKSL